LGAIGIAVVVAIIYSLQLNQMVIATKATRDAVCVASRTLSETVRSNRAQEQAAKDALEATLNIAREDQRAWIAPFSSTTEQTADGKFYFTINYKNTGRSPALQTRGFTGTASNLADVPIRDAEVKPGGLTHLVVAPEEINNSLTPNLDGTVIDRIRNGGKLYIYGTVWYSDIFKRRHWTQFCYYPGRDLKNFSPCSKHNTTDDAEDK
jgi:hypothetical protein